MILAIEANLSATETKGIRKAAADLVFMDGRAAAIRLAREVKATAQVTISPASDAALAHVEKVLQESPVFNAAARPRIMTRLIPFRYRPGQAHGQHVEDALMQRIWTDLSFTLFLTGPENDYGGAPEVPDRFETRSVK